MSYSKNRRLDFDKRIKNKLRLAVPQNTTIRSKYEQNEENMNKISEQSLAVTYFVLHVD